jgi:hypothetical protein
MQFEEQIRVAEEVYCVERQPTLRRNMSPPTSGSKRKPSKTPALN